MTLPLIAEKFIHEALELLKPEKIYPREIKVNKDHFNLKGRSFEIKQNLHLVGIGKASAYEVKAMRDFLKGTDLAPRLQSCMVMTKEGQGVDDQGIVQWEGTHPVVSRKNIDNTKEFIKELSEIPDGDTLLFLLSGGTSSLLEIPKEGISFEELKKKNETLLSSGLGINSMNEERKKLSQVKGGGFAQFVKGKEIIQLVTCDIPNENLADVGSGPLIDSKGTFLEKTVMIQSASVLLSQLCHKPNWIQGDVFDCPVEDLIESLKNDLPNGDEVLVTGGECPIRLPEKPGLGGRNTHFVLAFADEIYKDPRNHDLHILSLATDGGDGPTDGAGAYINFELYNKEIAAKELKAYNSYSYFKKRGSLIKTGPTQTNVMDLRFIWREKN